MAETTAAALDEAHRQDWALVLASTVRVTRDLDTAEDCVQHAYAQALTSWERHGVPANPAAWLTTVARNRAFDVRRRDTTATRKLPLLVDDSVQPEPAASHTPGAIPDERLRLICTCCHPALSLEAQVALTLRLVCGLTTVEVARAFLVAETTMAARITRAKKKIAAARIPYRVPPAAELPERVRAVLEVVHLLYTTGHTSPSGDVVRRPPLVERAVDLARMLRALLPDDPEVAGLLALILLTDARQRARIGPDGELVLLANQDRALWDRATIDEGLALLGAGQPQGRFGLMAAIAAVHSAAPSWDATDWARLVSLYDALLERWPSPVVALNRAVAVGFAGGPGAGLAAMDALSDDARVATYRYLASARAEFLRRLGRCDDARLAYEEAMLLTDNAVERRFLQRQLQQLGLLSRPGVATLPAMSKALVLGGGGPVGIGWEAGLISGLAAAGVTLADASVVVGTSAGSVVGAHLSAGTDLEDLVRNTGGSSDGPSGIDARTAKGLEGLMVAAAEALAHPGPPEEARAQLGRFALAADTPTEDEFLLLFATLEGFAWPDQFACTAVDTETGAFAVWDRTSGVALPRGVALSCSVPGVFPPVTIHGRRWMDGGMRSALNTDVARGHDVVVGVSAFPLTLPEGLSDPVALQLAGQTDAELDVVRAGGARLAIVEPNQEFLELSGFGLNLMDFSLAVRAFEAGVRQAATEASRVGEAWG